MFKPCGHSLERLAEIHEEQMQRNHQNRQGAMSRRQMKPETATYLSRYDAAVKVCIAKLQQIEQHHPELLETPST